MHLGGIREETPHNHALHIMGDVPEAHGEAVVEALGKRGTCPL